MFYTAVIDSLKNKNNNTVYVVKQKATNAYYTIKRNHNLPMILAFRNKNHCTYLNDIVKNELLSTNKNHNQDSIVVQLPLSYLNRTAPNYQLPVLVVDENLNDEEYIDVCNDVNNVRYTLEDHFTYNQ